MNTETGVIKRAAEYHKAWKELKKESGLMQLMFLFLCRASYNLLKVYYKYHNEYNTYINPNALIICTIEN